MHYMMRLKLWHIGRKDAAMGKSVFGALNAITIKPFSPFRRTSALFFATTLRSCSSLCDARAMNGEPRKKRCGE